MENVYLKSFRLPDAIEEGIFLSSIQRTCYNGYYPFGIFPKKELKRIDFGAVTVLYGNNGSGKTTLLNLIAEKCGVTRHSAFSGSAFFGDYVDMCHTTGKENVPEGSQILTSDDVSDYLLNIRYLNDGIDVRRTELFDEWVELKYTEHRLKSLDDYDEWKKSLDAKTKSQSKFVKERLRRNVDMRSNGETAMRYYVERINENALYIIDEPENSLSVELQLELADYISKSARYFGCQFIISTHSPFFLSIDGARVSNLDAVPSGECKWYELKNVRSYYDFFMRHRDKFE